MTKIKENMPYLFLFLGVILTTFIVTSVLLPKAESIKPDNTKEETVKKNKEMLRLSAVGDSLTEGIGDNTQSGGYLPLLQRDLNDSQPIDVVQAENYGKSGDRSDQILKRLKKNEDMQESVKKADVILITVGGNDLMKVIQTKMFGKMTLKTFEKPRKKYQEQLDKLYEEIRSLNDHAPIYQLGIYNPFYKNFSEIEEMQEIVDFWNEGSAEFTASVDNAFFVPINEDIYNGLATIDDVAAGHDLDELFDGVDVLNNLLSEEDSFHPNNLGYQIIANAFKSKMLATKELWLD